ncbi:MAG: DUF2703 domain-containing protein [Bacteroidota bacterium]
MKIQFLYFESCPNHHNASELLRTVLGEHNIETDIERIEIKNEEDAVKHQFVGSPTIRINGVDIEKIKGNPIYAKTCRVYTIDGKLTGMPSRQMIEDALGTADLEDKEFGAATQLRRKGGGE